MFQYLQIISFNSKNSQVFILSFCLRFGYLIGSYFFFISKYAMHAGTEGGEISKKWWGEGAKVFSTIF